MTDKLTLAEQTSEEARRALTADSFLILPMGSLEDQGTHAPMGDYLFAEALALSYATLDDMIAGFLRHGLDRIFIVNGHGNNVAPINEVTMR
ncbi:creatininase family protein [Pseudooceanicola marinus]|uniref:creatininase family protein n=1 Tax=Pseudooceanicola marinus TaxID=396013 RepID=UPI001CD6AC8E|nr:creatininase family protein [Pseudooceanicola marinus]MCA1334538.1 creatininase family protein [Pseudooceanicola marinus]